MFCKNCGKEIEDSAKFCDGCGASVEGTTSQNSGAAKAILGEIKVLFKGFFSKNPCSVIEISKTSESKFGVIFILFNAILYGFAFCCNISQVLNNGMNSVISSAESAVSDLIGGFGSALAEDAISELSGGIEKIPVLWDLVLPLALIDLVVTAIIIACIYIVLKVKKQPLNPLANTLNIVGVAGLPIIIACALNLILGLILPQYTLLIFVIGVLASIVLLYEGLKDIFKVEKPLFEIIIMLSAVLVIATIILNIALDKVGESFLNMISSEFSNVFGNALKDSLF